MNEQKKMERCLLLPFAVCVGVVGLWLTGVWLVHVAGHGQGLFEGLSALFSGLAFIGLIFTLIYQRRELLLQREELRKSREEAHATAMANQESAKIALNKVKIDFITAEISKTQEMYRLSSHVPEHKEKYELQLDTLRKEYEKIIKELFPQMNSLR